MTNEVHHFGTHIFAKRGIEIGERLVKQHEARASGNTPRNGHALLLSARQFGGMPMVQRYKARELQRMFDPRMDFGGG